MSVEPQAIERSVLEQKTGDELAAIAEALGMKPSPRARKGDLVDQILREAGVETARPPEGEVADKPRRRTRRPKDSGGENGAAETDTTGEGEPAAAPTGEAAGAPADPPPSEPAVAGTEREDRPAAPAEAAAPAPPGPDAPPDAAPAPAGEHERAGGGEAGEERGPEPPADRGESERSRDRGPDRGQAQGQPRQAPFDAGADAANRRNRRRRGRERDREIPAQDRPDQPYSGELVPVEGLLDLRDEGYGFLRTSGYLASPRDVYVSLSQVRRFALRKGDYLVGASRPASSNEKYPALVRIDTVSGLSPDDARVRPRFEDLTPLFPDTKLRMEIAGEPHNMVARIVDLICPIGKGQRGLIVSPPKAGKTTIMKQVCHSIEQNNPEVHLVVLLVDERPEEVTDMRRSLKRGEVAASTFDRPADEHTQVAELTIERAKRMVEMGKDVCIVLDGITRLARAYNLAAPASGRILSGGVDSAALYPPKKFFGAARNIEEGGSLTILATALVETGSRMDEVIFEEFKGTGNMELRLDRKLAERRIYPAIDVNASSTRHEELLFERRQLEMVWRLRRVLNGLSEGGSAAAGLELLMDKIRSTRGNDEFLAEIAKAPAPPMM